MRKYVESMTPNGMNVLRSDSPREIIDLGL